MGRMGEWELDASIDSKVTAIHACLTRFGQVLFFHCRSFPFWTRLYDPITNEVIEENFVIPKWPIVYDGEDPPYLIQPSRIFCCGHCFLPDGRLLAAGGELDDPYPYSYEPIGIARGLRYSFTFTPSDGSGEWSVEGGTVEPYIMDDGRWYPTLTLLEDGTVVAMGGLSENIITLPTGIFPTINRIPDKYDEFSDPAGWIPYDNPSAIMPLDISYSYPDAHVIPFGVHEGKIFYATTQLVPTSDPPTTYEDGYSQIFNPYATGSGPYWSAISNRRTTPSEMSAGILMPIRKDPNTQAKVIIIGGKWGNPLDRIDVIDLNNSDPVWTSNVETLVHARYNHSVVILPDRTALIVGGNTIDNSNGSVLTPELLDTDTMELIDDLDIPDLPVARNYHSIALLLPDARVFVAGGRVTNGGDVEDDTERRISIFKPEYLLYGARPEIVVSPDEITYKETFIIKVTGASSLDSIALMKPGAVTHGNDMDQRYVELDFTPGLERDTYDVTAPANASLAPPGYYMLFALKDKTESISGNSKIPSVAKFVKLLIES